MPTALRQQAYPFGSLRKDPHWSVQGLVFYSQFSPARKLIDESPYGNDGVITGATWVGNGLLFENNGDHFSIPYSDKLPAGTTNFTIVMDFRYADRNISALIDTRQTTAPYTGLSIYTGTGSTSLKKISFDLNDTSEHLYRNKYGPDLDDGQFHMLVFVFDRSANLFHYYHDGIEQTGGVNISAVGGSIDSGLDYQPMKHSTTSTFSGWGDLRYWYHYNRALSASEISALYTNPALPMQQPPIWLFTLPPVVGAFPKGPLGHPLYGPFAGPIAC